MSGYVSPFRLHEMIEMNCDPLSKATSPPCVNTPLPLFCQ